MLLRASITTSLASRSACRTKGMINKSRITCRLDGIVGQMTCQATRSHARFLCLRRASYINILSIRLLLRRNSTSHEITQPYHPSITQTLNPPSPRSADHPPPRWSSKRRCSSSTTANPVATVTTSPPASAPKPKPSA